MFKDYFLDQYDKQNDLHKKFIRYHVVSDLFICLFEYFEAIFQVYTNNNNYLTI